MYSEFDNCVIQDNFNVRLATVQASSAASVQP
jgi:hypothetical protein